MIPEQAKLEIRLKRAAGEGWTGISKWMEDEYGISIHRSTIQRWHDKEEVSELEDELLSDEVLFNARIKLDKKVATYKGEADFYKKLYQQSIKNTAKKEIIVETIHEYAAAFPAVPLVSYKASKVGYKGTNSQTVVAPLSDTHIGESVNAEQMNHLNSYNLDIFNKRLWGWATQLLNLINYRRNIAPVDNLIVPMLGDMISGDIHDELAKSNVANCMEQMIRGASLISQALLYLAPHFDSIKVPCVVGNHGRMTRKPPMKDKYMDWDFMLYQWVAAFCKNQTNISFDIPKSFINVFSVYDHDILLMHGDVISGGGSSVSISNAVSRMRGVLQYRKNLITEVGDAVGVDGAMNFDSVMIGHFHRIDEIDIGTGELHICGCMKGPDEFALQRLLAASKPKQLVTYWHPKYGYIGKEVIYLNRYDNGDDKFIDAVPETWSDMIKLSV